MGRFAKPRRDKTCIGSNPIPSVRSEMKTIDEYTINELLSRVKKSIIQALAEVEPYTMTDFSTWDVVVLIHVYDAVFHTRVED
jgi:hypothetical protein